MSEPEFVAASPVWWQSQTEVSVCLALGEDPDAALRTIESVGACVGPLPEVLMLVERANSPSVDAVSDWLLRHLWLPAIVLQGSGGVDSLHTRARAPRVIDLETGVAIDPRALLGLGA